MTASGCSDQHRTGLRRGGVAVQAALDGGALVPVVQVMLQTRPIFHKCDETIRGHVFFRSWRWCSVRSCSPGWGSGVTSWSGPM